MQCPNCQFQNPEGSNFCLDCGKKLEQKCPQCENCRLTGAKFCNKCGQNLTNNPSASLKEISLEEKFDRIQRYLPAGLIKKILSQKKKIEGERRQVTIMFCDMKAFVQKTATPNSN